MHNFDLFLHCRMTSNRSIQDLPQSHKNLMPYIELTNRVIKTQTGLPNTHNGLNIGVIVGIKSYEDLKSNILSTHNNI
ncbi:hypothetical protein Lal_00024237 [Lupinus albus]|nr:hypothetical protein Lal_00024237 [Lupinus albus]